MLLAERTVLPAVYGLVVLGGLVCAGFEVHSAAHLQIFFAENVVVRLGCWSIRLLLLTVAIGPLSRAPHRAWLRQWHRPLGLLALVFALCHVTLYIHNVGANAATLQWIITSPYLVMGSVALLLLVPIALASPRLAMRRLGSAAWRRIHVAAYPVLVLLLMHECLYSHDSSSELILHALAIGAILALRFRTRVASYLSLD